MRAPAFVDPKGAVSQTERLTSIHRSAASTKTVFPDFPEVTDMAATRQSRGTIGVAPPQDADTTARRRAALVAAIAGFGVPVWFWVTMALWEAGDTPPPGAPAQDFLAYYVDNYASFPASVTAHVLLWVLLLVLLVAVVRAAVTRLDLTAILAITLAGVATACTVMAEGVLAWPALTYDQSPELLAVNLEPGVAQALVLSRDGLHAPALVLWGLALLLIAWLVARSDLWGRTALAVLTAVVGVFSAGYILLGPESIGSALTVPWGLAMAIGLLIDRARR